MFIMVLPVPGVCLGFRNFLTPSAPHAQTLNSAPDLQQSEQNPRALVTDLGTGGRVVVLALEEVLLHKVDANLNIRSLPGLVKWLYYEMGVTNIVESDRICMKLARRIGLVYLVENFNRAMRTFWDRSDREHEKGFLHLLSSQVSGDLARSLPLQSLSHDFVPLSFPRRLDGEGQRYREYILTTMTYLGLKAGNGGIAFRVARGGSVLRIQWALLLVYY